MTDRDGQADGWAIAYRALSVCGVTHSKLICFINTFLRSLSGPIWAAVTDLELPDHTRWAMAFIILVSYIHRQLKKGRHYTLVHIFAKY